MSTMTLSAILVMFCPMTGASALIFIRNDNGSLPLTPTSNTTAVASAKPLSAVIPALLRVFPDPIAVGHTQNIVIHVNNTHLNQPIKAAKVSGTIINSSNSSIIHHAMQLLSANSTNLGLGQIFNGPIASNGTYNHSWTIGPHAKIGVYSVVVQVSAQGFTPYQAARQFLVTPK
jgi:hypothetical protein